MSFLGRVGAAFESAGVRYALVGGYAVALHGAVRGTVDVDVILAWNFYNPTDLTEQLDIVIATDLKGKKVRNIQTADGSLRVLALQDLIAMKRASGRPQDLADIAALEQLR